MSRPGALVARCALIDIGKLEGLYVFEQNGERFVVMLSAFSEDNVTFGRIVE